MKVFAVLVTLFSAALCKDCYYCTDFAADVDLPEAARESIAGSMVPCETNTTDTCSTTDALCVSIAYSIDLILEATQAEPYTYSVNMYFCGSADVGQSLCDNYQSMYQGYNSQSNGMTLVDCSHSSAEGNLSNNPFNSDAVTSVEDESSGAGSVMSSLFSVVAIVFLL